MVLGLRSSKNKKGTLVHVECTVHIIDIKPWTPSQSVKPVNSVFLQWQNGDSNSGMTNTVALSVRSAAAEGKIEFNESFKLNVNLTKESSKKGNGKASFQKNILEFNLHEPRKDKSKGQHLGHGAVDFADYCIITEAVTVSIPFSSKKNNRKMAQPILCIKIQPSNEESESSSFGKLLSKETSTDKDANESASVLMSEEIAEETEIASFTDDDITSHSSEQRVEFSIRTSPDEQERHKDVSEQKCIDGDNIDKPIHSDLRTEEMMKTVKSESTFSDFPDEDIIFIDAGDSINLNIEGRMLESSTEETVVQETIQREIYDTAANTYETLQVNSEKTISDKDTQGQIIETNIEYQASRSIEGESVSIIGENYMLTETEVASKSTTAESMVKSEVDEDNSAAIQQTMNGFVENLSTNSGELMQQVLLTKQPIFQQISEASVDLSISIRKSIAEKRSNTFSSEKFEKLKLSTRSPPHLNGGFMKSPDKDKDFTDVTSQEYVIDNEVTRNLETKSAKSGKRRIFSRANRSALSNERVRELEYRVKLLEGELREAAGIEIGLYAIVAVHGSSLQKVHTPARRLSRQYCHASKEWPVERRATAAKSIVAGLTLAAKACGNDTQRLAFWLSNTVVLRVAISETAGSDFTHGGSERSTNSNNNPSQLKWESISHKNEKSLFSDEFEDWVDHHTFISALEKIETWMFTRIVESVWWQVLTPFMQCAPEYTERKMTAKSKATYQRMLSMYDQNQTNSSIEIWIRAFKDAAESICAVRAAGHDCGCLPLLAKLVMEQCAAKLDVSIFNAILRDSNLEVSTNPVSDPISDLKVLPIPPGEFSFGTGIQLKNAIGYWSKCLSDLFCVGMQYSNHDETTQNGEDVSNEPAFKLFPLLDSLSDLLILPKDMLFDKSLRKEVCPTFSSSLIKQILDHFLPDELCPDPLPPTLLKALDSEEPLEMGTKEISNIPCNMYPVNYSPPSDGSIKSFIGNIRSVSSHSLQTESAFIRKCHTSDDELDELDTPLESTMIDRSTPQRIGTNSPCAIRYQLLREVWKNDK